MLFRSANLVVNDDSTLLTYVKFVGDFHTIGIGALLALIGLFIIVVLHHKNIKGSILIGILATWILGMICEAIGLYVPDGKEFYSLYPTFRMIDFGAFGTTFGQCFNVDFSGVDILNFIAVLFAFLFVDIFDTLGTLIGVPPKRICLMKKENFLASVRLFWQMPSQLRLVLFSEHQLLLLTLSPPLVLQPVDVPVYLQW